MSEMDFDSDALQIVRERRSLISLYDEWLFEEFHPYIGQRILEIGCGLGNMLKLLVNHELIVGLDISEESVAQMRSTFSSFPNIQAIVRDITDPTVIELSQFEFDTAISINVFEHIQDDLVALENTRKLLIPSGILILVVPAHPFLFGSLDRSIGHFRRYSIADMSSKLIASGYQVLQLRYINMIGGIGWLVNGRVLRRRVPPTAQLRLFNRMVPILRRAENRIGSPFGISLLAISRRVD